MKNTYKIFIVIFLVVAALLNGCAGKEEKVDPAGTGQAAGAENSTEPDKTTAPTGKTEEEAAEASTENADGGAAENAGEPLQTGLSAYSDLVPICVRASEDAGYNLWGFAKDTDVSQYFKGLQTDGGDYTDNLKYSSTGPKYAIEPRYLSVTGFNRRKVAAANSDDSSFVLLDEEGGHITEVENAFLKRVLGDYFVYYDKISKSGYIIDSGGSVLAEMKNPEFLGYVADSAVYSVEGGYLIFDFKKADLTEYEKTEGQLPQAFYVKTVLDHYKIDAAQSLDDIGKKYEYKGLEFYDIQGFGDFVLVPNTALENDDYKSLYFFAERDYFKKTLIDTAGNVNYDDLINYFYWVKMANADFMIGASGGEMLMQDLNNPDDLWQIPKEFFFGKDFYISKNGLLYAKIGGEAVYAAEKTDGFYQTTGQTTDFYKKDDTVFFTNIFAGPGFFYKKPHVLAADKNIQQKLNSGFADEIRKIEASVRDFGTENLDSGYLLGSTTIEPAATIWKNYISLDLNLQLHATGGDTVQRISSAVFNLNDGTLVEGLDDIFKDGSTSTDRVLLKFLEKYKDPQKTARLGLEGLDQDRAKGPDATSYAGEVFYTDSPDFNFKITDSGELVLRYQSYKMDGSNYGMVEFSLDFEAYGSELK